MGSNPIIVIHVVFRFSVFFMFRFRFSVFFMFRFRFSVFFMFRFRFMFIVV